MSPSPEFPSSRGYSWRDAWPGNDLAVKHGAKVSVEKLNADPRAQEVAADLLDRMPWLADPAFGDALNDLRLVRQRIERAVAWIEEHGDFDETGKPRHAAQFLNDLLRLARNLRADVGATPVSWAKIAQALTTAAHHEAGLDELIEKGEAIRLARENAQEPPDDDGSKELDS